jgi:sorting nexin-8
MVKTRQLHPKPIFDEPSLRNFLSRYDVKAIHMGKIWRHLLAHPECPLDEIPGIPTIIREPLKQEFAYTTSTVVNVVESSIDGTVKLLIRLQDGGEIEAVIIRHSGEAEHPDQKQADRCGARDTLCISSQVGCRLGCTFCATGTMGLQGNLWSGEIQEQLVHARALRSVTNVVFMGMGEPLENYDSVTQAIRGLVDTGKFGMAPRSVTVSTVGVVGNMKRLMNDLPQIKLAVSLHAPTQELREQIVPIAKTFKLDSLMDAVDEYASKITNDGKRKGMVMVSYVLLSGVNDTDTCAYQLRDLVKDRPVIVNLIPYNPFDGNPHEYETPSAERVDAFLQILESADIRVFERRHHGRDIAAACGQLAKINLDKQPIDIENCSGKLAKERMRQVSSIEHPSGMRKHKDNTKGATPLGTATAGCSSKALQISIATVFAGTLGLLLVRWRSQQR